MYNLQVAALGRCLNNLQEVNTMGMKLNNKLTKSIIFVFVSYSVAFAGAGSSGGGDAVVCYENDSITTAKLLDLYEGESLFGDQFNNLSGSNFSYEVLLETALNRLDKTSYGYIGMASKLSRGKRRKIREYVELVDQKKRLIVKDITLSPINDSNEIFLPAKNCEIAQAASFVDENTILFDQNIWNKLSNLDKAALVLHEAVYWYDRVLTRKFDSTRSRRVVSQAFTDDFNFVDVTDGLPSAYTLCEVLGGQGPEDEEWMGGTAFVVYPSKEEDHIKIMQYFSIGGEFLLSKKTSIVSNDFPFLKRLRGDVVHRSTQGYTDSMSESSDLFRLSSHPEYDENGVLIPGANKLYISIEKYSYPIKMIKKKRMNCYYTKNFL